ncbi:unnamed protein product [Linum trigynum]|uniref:Uncharacterized protein n=1 Tax=Linum trigynum TaxID=586398 RepID=A0AAV2GJA2_9ROSI
MSNPTDKQLSSRQNMEVVTVQDVTTSKYDAMAASLESLTKVTVRATEASKGSIGAIEAMGDQIKASIEEMGKSVAENICGALAATMQEVLTQVPRNREPPASTAMGPTLAAVAAARAAAQEGGDGREQGGAASRRRGGWAHGGDGAPGGGGGGGGEAAGRWW